MAYLGTTPVASTGLDTTGTQRNVLTDTSGNQQIVGQIPVGYQLNTYNVTYTTYTVGTNTINLIGSYVGTTFTKSQPLSPILNGGVDQSSTARNILTDSLGVQLVRGGLAIPGQQSIEDLLTQILGTLRVLTHYTYEDQLRAGFRSSADEPDVMLADYINPASNFTNMTN